MLVKESSDLTLQLSCVIQLTHGTRMFKKFALDFCGKIVPLHDDCGAEAPQNMLLFCSFVQHGVPNGTFPQRAIALRTQGD